MGNVYKFFFLIEIFFIERCAWNLEENEMRFEEVRVSDLIIPQFMTCNVRTDLVQL